MILLATDGIFDNLYAEDIIDIIDNEKLSLEERNVQVAKQAFVNSLDPKYFIFSSSFSLLLMQCVYSFFSALVDEVPILIAILCV